MPHGFPTNVGKSAAQALDAVGAFLTERLHAQRAIKPVIKMTAKLAGI